MEILLPTNHLKFIIIIAPFERTNYYWYTETGKGAESGNSCIEPGPPLCFSIWVLPQKYTLHHKIIRCLEFLIDFRW